MTTVYKYCGSWGVDIIKNLELKITPPNQFNDPFEFTPHVICSDPKSEIKIFREPKYESLFIEEYQKQKASGKFGGSLHEFKKKCIDSHGMETILNMNTNLQSSNLDLMSAHIGVLCLSKERNSIVMWGHYGDEHHGLVIGFDSSDAIFQVGAGLHPVNYVQERVAWDTSWEMGGAQECKYLKTLVFSKNEEWKYESELRQIFLLDQCPIKKPFNDKRTGKEMIGHFQRIAPEALVGVSLGAKCSPELEKNVQLVLQDKHLSHVKLDRARLHKSRFELTFE